MIAKWNEYQEAQHICDLRTQQIFEQADEVIAENLEAFKELAKLQITKG